jgi:hypothetical protein
MDDLITRGVTVTVNTHCAPQKLRMLDGSIVTVQPGESLTTNLDAEQMREVEVSPGHFTFKVGAEPVTPLPVIEPKPPQPQQRPKFHRRGRR